MGNSLVVAVVSMIRLLIVWELSIIMAYWRCSNEHLDDLPERVLLGMQVVSLLDKLSNMGEQRAGRAPVMIKVFKEMRKCSLLGRMVLVAREVKGGSITGTAPESQTGLIRTFERLPLVVITMCKLMKLGTKNAGRD
jgi:hypothetical protein